MMMKRHTWLPLGLLLVAALLIVWACTEQPTGSVTDDDPGLHVRVTTTSPALLPSVNYFVLTVTADDMTPVVVDSRFSSDTSTSYIYFDGQTVTVRVEVPAGRNRTFVLAGMQQLPFGVDNVLYRAVQVFDVEPGRRTEAALALEPVAPMVRLSPRRSEVSSGEALTVDLQVANIPNLAVLDVRIDADQTYVKVAGAEPSAELVAAFGDDLVFTGYLEMAAPRYRIVVATNSDVPFVDARGFATVATVHLQTTAYTHPQLDSLEGRVDVAVQSAARPSGDIIPTEDIYVDRALVWMDLFRDSIVTFPDPNLQNGIVWAAGLETPPIYLSDVLTISSLSLGESGILDWTGIQTLRNLASMDCSWGNSADMTLMAQLPALRTLECDGNSITDLSTFAGLTGLTTLSVYWNDIVNLQPLSGLANLRALDVSGNPVTDITPLASLTGLLDLDLADDTIASIAAVANMDHLRRLDLSGNRIVDLSALQSLEDLHWVDLAGNLIEDVAPLYNNPGLATNDTLYLSGNSDSLWASSTQVNYIGQMRERGVIVFTDR